MNDKYLKYNIEDFLGDDDFVNWVLDGTKDKQWQSWLSSRPKSIKQIKKAQKMVAQLKFVESQETQVAKKRTWQRINASTQVRQINLNTQRRWLYGLAAAAAIALLSLFILPDRATNIATDVAMTEAVTLPSNSMVTLAPSSSISYKEKEWSEKRDVELTGQAHFSVTKGVPFIVRTDNGSVQVLGTEFDVTSEDKTFYVLVSEGRVSVSSDNYSKILTAGMAFFKNPLWEGEARLSEKWKTDQIFFAFKDQKLSEVLKAITFFYDLKVNDVGVDASIKYTGSFDTSADIKSSLQKILWPLRIDFELSNGLLRLSHRDQ